MNSNNIRSVGFLENPQNKIFLIGLFIFLLGIFLFFVPGIIGLDGFDGGFALRALSVMLVLPTGITVMVMYRKRARMLGEILSGEKLIVHWKYGKEEWDKYTEEEYIRDKSNKKIMFIILLVISLLVGIGFLIIAEDKEAGIIVFGGLMGLVIFIKILTMITTRLAYKNNKNNLGDVYIGYKGVYLNKRLHTRGGITSWLEKAKINKETNCIDITYSIIARHGKDYNTIYVPIPLDKKGEVEGVIKEMLKSK